jgi:F-type H+-transporting ATPase subunit epsilon
MELIILQPDRTIFKGDVNSVNLPGTVGKFSVLKGHAPMISSLKSGIVKYIVAENGEEFSVRINGGFVSIKRDIVKVCAE